MRKNLETARARSARGSKPEGDDRFVDWARSFPRLDRTVNLGGRPESPCSDSSMRAAKAAFCVARGRRFPETIEPAIGRVIHPPRLASDELGGPILAEAASVNNSRQTKIGT